MNHRVHGYGYFDSNFKIRGKGKNLIPSQMQDTEAQNPKKQIKMNNRFLV